MADDNKHPVRDIIVFPVIAALVIAALLYFIPKLLAFVLDIISQIWNYFLSKTLLPNSILGLLIILAIPTIVNLVKHTRNKRNRTSDQIGIQAYKSDNIFEMVWKWGFISDMNMPSNDLSCFCPSCGIRLVYDTSYDARMQMKTVFSCQNCKFESIRFDGNRNDALGRVRREVERRVNNGEWQNAVKK